MQTDRELLELAAKAGGIKVLRSRLDDPMHKDLLAANSARNTHHPNGPWNPLSDDGDAFRLAVALGIEPGWYKQAGYAAARAVPASGNVIRVEEYGSDGNSTTRRAIVRAAAAMAEQVQDVKKIDLESH